MSKYLTLSQYKRVGDGLSLADVSDMTLAYTVARAESAIDAHMGFDPKRGGFEPHYVSIQHAFDEHTLKTISPQYPVPLRQITRYRIQVSNLSTSGAGFFANISAADCVINNDGFYVEIVPLQAVTYSLSPILIQLGLKPPIVEMDCEIGYYLPVLGEQMIDSGDHTTYYALNGFWATSYTLAAPLQPLTPPPVPPVVYANGSVVLSSNYTYNQTEGSVTFTTARTASDVITVDYTQTIPDYVTEAAVIQVSHLLGQRNLNKVGLNGLELARSGDQDMRRPRIFGTRAQNRSTATALCDEASSLLSKYEQWAMA